MPLSSQDSLRPRSINVGAPTTHAARGVEPPATSSAGTAVATPTTAASGVKNQQPANGVGAQAIAGSAILGLFAIPLGIAGLGGVWQAMRATLSAPAWPAETLFATSTAIWIVLTAVYVASALRRPDGFTADRTHVIYGPFAAYIPVIGVLLSSHYVTYAHTVARAAVIVFVVALAIIAAQLLAHWLQGNLPVATFHPGYFLPTVAGAFIASIGLSLGGWPEAAKAAFGIGAFFWLTIGTLIFGRLFTGAPLPDAIKPALSVLVSPPATAGIAWFLITGGRLDNVEYILLGMLFMMLLVQTLFFAEYHKLSFTTNFWAFTFPVAASTNLVVRWLNVEAFPFWRAMSWSLAGIATAFVLALAVATVVDRTRSRHRTQRLSLDMRHAQPPNRTPSTQPIP